MAYDDVYRQIAVSTLAINSAGGAVTSIQSVGAQTYVVDLVINGATTSTSGARIGIGDLATSVTSTVGSFLPTNWIQRYKVTPGQKIAAISNDGQTANLSITELSK